MNATQAERFQQLLVEAVDHYVDDGGRLVDGTFHSLDGLCPLTCLFGKLPNTAEMAAECQQLIGIEVESDEIWSFISGFDNWKSDAHYMQIHPAAALIGKALRAKYIKE